MNIPSAPSDFKPRQRGLHKLTDRTVKALIRPGRHADGGGLYVEVRPTGTKSWIFISKRDGRQRVMGLGGYPTVTLAMARERAAAVRKALAEGGDPFAERKQEAEPTFGEAARRYVDAHGATWRSRKTRKLWTTALQDYAAPIWYTRVAEVDVAATLAVLDPIWQRIPASAARVRNQVELILDFARAHGWRTGENPARWRGGLSHLLPKPGKVEAGHYQAIPYRDAPGLMQQLREVRSVASLALQFLALTAARSGEVRLVSWDEIDFDAATWTIPALRMKAGKQHVVPLPDAALGLLHALRELGLPGDHVFPGRKRGQPIGENSMFQLLRRFHSGATVHGMRSAFRDWAGDETGFAREVIEQALAHQVGSAVERAYRRGSALEKRRQLMQAWAGYLSGTQDAKVVPLRS